MATPLEQFTNARIYFAAPGGRGGPEDGYQELPGQEYIIGGFLKQVTEKKRGNFKDLVDLRVSTEIFEGYITGFCPLPAGEDWKTYDYRTDVNYDTTGYRPTGFVAPASAELVMSGQYFASCELLDSAGVFFDEGIGSIVRDVIGDRLIVKFERY